MSHAEVLGLTGGETYSVIDLEDVDALHDEITVRVESGGEARDLTVRIDTAAEDAYFQHAGILLYMRRQMLRS